MSGLRVVLRGEQLGPKIQHGMKRNAEAVRAATRATAAELADRMLEAGRASIAAGGKFGGRWTSGLRAVITEGGGHVVVSVSHDMGPLFGIFEYGGVIRGKPLLYFKPAPGFVEGDPEVISVKSVTIPQKFHVREECAKVARQSPDIYRQKIKEELA